jgi:hypothetical protein
LVISLRSKPIVIELFPGCKVQTRVLGSKAPGKDLILGWDNYYAFKRKFNISLEPTGLQWQNLFKQFTATHRLFSLEPSQMNTFEGIKASFIARSCADSHTDFLKKCSNPLWLNPEFFVQLPFKTNLLTTPTKASHAGMSPDLLKQANEECEQLIQQGLVSPTNSPWACKAFYVNNRAEQVRGKLRLVIDYKPLNEFLQDVKFPLPTRKSLLQHLSGAVIFSKFDLKSGFWQLGVHPDEQYKTAFCLPNRHLQWKVLPFGLKTAPSLFQQAMLKIFRPILHTALVYIDDILLFSTSTTDHVQLLQQFQSITEEYGIMLSARKMVLAQPNIDFLGVHITDGKFAPQAHLATELLTFPEDDLSKRQVQQFLGVINYLSDFVPKLSKLTQPLRKMLMKNPPPWTSKQTAAVRALKQVIQKLPPLKIPSTGLRIVQSDASDKYWGAVLLEEVNGKRQICGYRSGRFKDSEMHYHSTFKEILAVKKAIEKFEFHLIGHKFQVEMDMSSFPKMLHFKQKVVPHQQLLRWSEWFSKYDFTSVYLKGTKNILADMLSRKPVTLIRSLHAIMSTVEISSSSVSSTQIPNNPNTSLYDFENNCPFDAKELIQTETLLEKTKHKVFLYQSLILSTFGPNNDYISPLGIHPDFPFAHLFRFRNLVMPEEVLCFLWYLCSIYTIGIHLDIPSVFQYTSNTSPTGFPGSLATFLTWFQSIAVWNSKLVTSAKYVMPSLTAKKLKKEYPESTSYWHPHSIWFFHRPININPTSKKVYAMPTVRLFKNYRHGITPSVNPPDQVMYEDFQAEAFRLNHTKQTFLVPFKDHWQYYPFEYQQSLDDDILMFQEKEKLQQLQHQQRSSPAQSNEDPAFPMAGYSQVQDDEMTDWELEDLMAQANLNEEAGPSTYSSPSPDCPKDSFGNYEHGCCDFHLRQFEMDH